MSDADKPVSPTIRITAWILSGFVAAAIAGSYIFQTEIVARGQGRIVPIGRVQIIQPRMPGTIMKIAVEEGQAVHAGQLLIAMDPTGATSKIDGIEARIALRRQEQVVAEAIVDPLTTSHRGPEHDVSRSLDGPSQALVSAIQRSLRDDVAQIDAESDELEKRHQVQQAKIKKAVADIEMLTQFADNSERLRKTGTISEQEYLTRMREFKGIKADAEIAKNQLKEITSSMQTTMERRASTISKVLVTYRKQLNDAQIALQMLNADLTNAKNELANLSLEAPVDGRVENLSVFTIGGFVDAGSNLMSIVPSGSRIEVEAFFDNRDVGFLADGQRASIKFDAFPAERFGVIRGHVLNVGADARDDSKKGQWVYAVRLSLDQGAMRIADRTFAFSPGMTATVDVVTGERRFISYFFEPILAAFQNSLGER